MNPQVDDQMVLLSQYYPDGIYRQFVPEQGVTAANNSKPRRRRKKNKGGDGGGGGGEGMMRKRKLSEEQVNMLEQSFGSEHKLESERKDRLASELGLDPRQVAVWFQNRRARWKSKKLEEEYSKLKSQHECAIIDKCRLETELVKLKEKLTDAQTEIQRLTERLDGFSSNSPSSSFSMEAIDHHHPPYFGEFGMDSLDQVFCQVPDNNVDYAHGMEWDSLYYV